VTTSQNMFKKPKTVYTSNQGIIAEATKKQRYDMHQWNRRQDWLRQLIEAKPLQKLLQTRFRGDLLGCNDDEGLKAVWSW